MRNRKLFQSSLFPAAFLLAVVLLLSGCDDNLPPGAGETKPDVKITDISLDGKSASTLSLSWTTDTASECSVEYGPYAFYGSTASASSGANKLQHSIELTGLRYHTSYDIKISANPESTDYASADKAEEFSTLTAPRGGFVTDGNEAVGALCFSENGVFYGPFATAVLIEPDWAITAAHCVKVNQDYYGKIPSASNTVLYLGGYDVSPGDGGTTPETGSTYSVTDIVVHENYNGSNNDLALIRLETPVSGVTPAVVNNISLGSYSGTEVYSAGFDSSNTEKMKQSYYYFDTPDTLTFTATSNYLLGESGFPAFMDIDGSDKLAGIISSDNPDNSSEPFGAGEAVYTRIDSYYAWINGKIPQ